MRLIEAGENPKTFSSPLIKIAAYRIGENRWENTCPKIFSKVHRKPHRLVATSKMGLFAKIVTDLVSKSPILDVAWNFTKKEHHSLCVPVNLAKFFVYFLLKLFRNIFGCASAIMSKTHLLKCFFLNILVTHGKK